VTASKANTLPFESGMYIVPSYTTGSASEKAPVKFGLPLVGMATRVCQAILSWFTFDLLIVSSDEYWRLYMSPRAVTRWGPGSAVRSDAENAGSGEICCVLDDALHATVARTAPATSRTNRARMPFISTSWSET